MTDKTSFTPDEWRQLLRSVSLAGVALTAASPSGPIGVVKEMFAAGKIVARARTEAASNELIKAVATDLATPEGRAQATEGMETDFAGASPDQIKTRAIEALRRAAAIVDAKADPQEMREFKMWLRSIGQSGRGSGQGGRFPRHRRGARERGGAGGTARDLGGARLARLIPSEAFLR